MKPLDKIISIIREEMMTTHSTPGKPGFSSAAPAKGPTAGYDKLLGKGKIERRKKVGVYGLVLLRRKERKSEG